MRPPAAAAILATALAIGGAALADEQARMAEIVIGAQMATASQGVERRDHLVSAAYAARRIVEDAPDSALAGQLLGAGVAVLGGPPLTFDGLQDEMIDACVAAPDALCLMDWSYILGARGVAADEAKIRELRAESPDIGLSTSGEMYGFHADAALLYARLGLAERVQATVAHHVDHVGQVALAERVTVLPDMVIALWLAGDEAGAARLGQELDEDAAAAPDWERLFVEFAPKVATTQLAVLELEAGRRDLDEVIAGGTSHQGLLEHILRAYRADPRPTWRDLADRVFELCKDANRFTFRNCGRFMVEIAAESGGAADVLAVIEAATAQGGSMGIYEPVVIFLDRGDGDAAAALLEARAPDALSPAWLGLVGSTGRPDLLERAEAAAMSMTEARDQELASIGRSYLLAGDAEGAARVFDAIADPVVKDIAIRSAAASVPLERAIRSGDLEAAVTAAAALADDPRRLSDHLPRLARMALPEGG